MENKDIELNEEITASKPCLFVSTSLDFILEYCPIEIDLVEYPPIFAKKQTYELLTPFYYAWLRSKIEIVNNLIESKKLNTEQNKEAQETMIQFEQIHNFAIENFTPESLENAIHEILRDPRRFIPTSYNPSKDINLVKLQSIDAPKTRLEPNLATKQEKFKTYYTTTSGCYADEAKEEGLSKSYFEFQKERLSPSRISGSSATSAASEDSSKDFSFSRVPNEAHSAESSFQRQATLSDLSNLTWIQTLQILESCQNNINLKTQDYPLYLKVTAYCGYRNSANPDNPNIGNDKGWLEFLGIVKGVVREVIEKGYYSFEINSAKNA